MCRYVHVHVHVYAEWLDISIDSKFAAQQILLIHVCCLVHVGGRNLLDVRSRLQFNTENQRLVAREADYLQLEMMGQETQAKMKVQLD